VTEIACDLTTEQEETYSLPGLSDTEPVASTFGVVLDTLLPSYKEVLSPTPLPIFRGSSLLNLPSADLGLGSSETSSSLADKDYTWSRGHGFEHSPIKTRSARRKEGNTSKLPVISSHSSSDIGVLRGMKALARANP
jgi:hypothetical protein